MALGGSPMSTTITSAGASVSIMPMSTAASSNDGGMAARGANYFFGFLITFVVLLLIFVGCGIGSRRRFLRRRQEGLFGGLDPWGQPKQEVEQKKPVFYEHPLGEPIFEDKWIFTTPLSMTLLRQPKEKQSTDPDRDLEANNSTPQNPNGRPLQPIYPRSITALMTPFNERKQSAPEVPDTTEYGAPEALDIAVMIAMPSPEHPYSQRSSSSMSSASKIRTDSDNILLPDVQIGVATIPWRTEIDSVS